MEDREIILQRLRDTGCRITKQRQVILDIILNGNPSCCKEIYREAIKVDKSIGSATVYRMVNTLEEIGVINRKNMYQVDCSTCESQCEDGQCDGSCATDVVGCTCNTNVVVELDDGTNIVIGRGDLKKVLFEGLKAQGKITNQSIEKIVM